MVKVVFLMIAFCFCCCSGKRATTVTTEQTVDAAIVQHSTHQAHVVDSIIYRWVVDGNRRVDSPQVAIDTERPQSGTITKVIYHHAYDTISQLAKTDTQLTQSTVQTKLLNDTWLNRDRFIYILMIIVVMLSFVLGFMMRNK